LSAHQDRLISGTLQHVIVSAILASIRTARRLKSGTPQLVPACVHRLLISFVRWLRCDTSTLRLAHVNAMLNPLATHDIILIPPLVAASASIQASTVGLDGTGIPMLVLVSARTMGLHASPCQIVTGIHQPAHAIVSNRTLSACCQWFGTHKPALVSIQILNRALGPAQLLTSTGTRLSVPVSVTQRTQNVISTSSIGTQQPVPASVSPPTQSAQPLPIMFGTYQHAHVNVNPKILHATLLTIGIFHLAPVSAPP
jgi:hypothetical protein